MKKSLLALAALASIAGTASAQSSVTLYGRAEANVTNSKPGSAVNGGNDVWRLDDGGDNSGIGGSRWGVRGNEDLGSGLKAYFQLESGFRSDTGAASDATKQFNRLAYVGLGSSSLGDVRLGRQETISRLINRDFSDVTAIGELKIDEGIGGGRQLFQTFGQRVDNVVAYVTPNWAGFQGQAMVGAGEGANARYEGIMASYKGGPLAVAIGYDDYNKFGARTSKFNKVFNVGANYNFGFMQLFGGYQESKDLGANTGVALAVGGIQKERAGTVGVMVPVGALQIRVNYVYAKYDLFNTGVAAQLKDADQQKYGASVRYALSKRTTLYSAITQRDGENKSVAGVTTDNQRNFTQKREITLLGVAHTF